MRWLLLVTIMCLVPQLALANCDDEARAARARALSAGPMHYEKLSWADHFTRRTCGKVDPGRAESKGPCADGAIWAHESMIIDTQSWSNDGLGWQRPMYTIWTHEGTVPVRVFPFQLRRTSCLGTVRINRLELTTYEFVVRIYNQDYVETLFVDVVSGLPVRYDQRPDGHRGVNYQTTYRHDPTLTLDPPVVDLEKRRAVSRQRLSEAVARSDPTCRREVLDVIRRGASTAFEYSLKGAFWAGVWGMNGVFSPPRSLHRRIEGAAYHGGGSELIVVGDEAWMRSQSSGWASTNVSGGADIAQLAPAASYIGRVDCIGRVTIEGRDYSVYDYDFYWDEDSSWQRGGMRRVFVDATTGLPARIEHFTNFGPRTEVRRYDATLSVRPPIVDTPAQPPVVPFDEFRRRLLEQ